MLALIGLGLCGFESITQSGLAAIKQADITFLEGYTSLLEDGVQLLEKRLGAKIHVLSREDMENKVVEKVIIPSQKKNVVVMVIGDIFSATTHTSVIVEAKKLDIPVHIIHNTSIMTAVGEIGLDLYKFGRTVSLVFGNNDVAYEHIRQNQSVGLHTLCLLDIKINEPTPESLLGKSKETMTKFLTIPEALSSLLAMEMKYKKKVITKATNVVGCARMGWGNQIVKYGAVEDLMKTDFGAPPHCLIVPSKKLHFMEEEVLGLF